MSVVQRSPKQSWSRRSAIVTVSTSLFFALAPNFLCAEDFEEVARVLESRCVGCHNLEQQQGDLAMDGPPDQWLETLVDVGNPSRSRLLEVVEQVDGVAEMPKDGAPLTKSEVSAIRKWLVSGAKWPSGHILKNSSTSRFDWWSYKTLRRPSLPGLRGNWIRTEVDEFVLSRLQKNGLQPSPSADQIAM